MIFFLDFFKWIFQTHKSRGDNNFKSSCFHHSAYIETYDVGIHELPKKLHVIGFSYFYGKMNYFP